MKAAAEKIEHVKTADLIPYVNNARTHSDEQVSQIAASIKEFGFGAPLLIDKDNGVIAGHARLLAAKKLKRATVPCVRMGHLSDAQRKALTLADNRLTLNSAWDVELLAVELDTLRDLQFDVSLLGFSKAELNDLIGTPNDAPAEGEQDEARNLLLIECRSERELQTLFEDMQSKGFTCKIMS